MVWIVVGSTVVGAVGAIAGSNKSSAAQDRATNAQLAPYEQYAPYVDANLTAGQAALQNNLNQGAYTGATYAGPNTFQTNTANTMGNFGADMMTSGNAMMNANDNFGSNYQDIYSKGGDLYGQTQNLYNQGSGIFGQNQDLYNQNQGLYNQFQGMSDSARDTDRLAVANQYAADNSGALVDAAMRDDRRNLMENTLTGIDMAASGSGNMNSSRAGVADAIANRAYDDRRADVAMGIQDRLVDRSLTNQAQQFADQGGALSNAGMAANSMSGNLAGSTNALSASGDLIQAGSNQLQTQGRANQGIRDTYNTGMETTAAGGDFGMTGGNMLQGYDQAALNDARANFERQRDFDLDTLKAYQAGMLGAAPASVGTVPVNNNNALSAGFGGAMQGMGFGQQLYGNNSRQATIADFMNGGPFSGYA